MTDDNYNLRQRATLTEFEFTEAQFGRLGARLRRAWGNVAARWQVWSVMQRQSAFNHALVDNLEALEVKTRAESAADVARDTVRIDHDRGLTRLNRDIAALAARARRAAAGADGLRQGLAPSNRRLRIAYFSPLPPARSGIADYSAELLPHLAERADVTVFVDSGRGGFQTRPYGVGGQPGNIFLAPMEAFPARRDEFDLPLYQMGNSDQHEAIYEMLLRFPGVVVLHDYVLHHFIRHHILGWADWNGYARELDYTLGPEGRRLAAAIRDGRAAAPLFDVPLNRRVIDASLGLIVHSRYAADRARQQRPDRPLAIVPALVEMRPGRSRRAELGLPEDAVLFGSFGQITAEKQIDLALRAFRGVREIYPNARYLLVGEARPDVDLAALISELGLGEAVHHVGFAPELSVFVDWIHTADVVVNLRYPTVGETSAIALRAMAAGRPVIVFDHGWYSELPDEAALKVAPLDAVALQEAMIRAAASAGLRDVLGRAAEAYVRRYCLPPRVADAYLDFLHAILEPAAAHA
ncbi:glycosyltransferase family 4 protein [Promineifilum sp.]|uniref:glycosyltransferase family 4 protein n=1 Tax=Promineifilum sp. TaxID=2664178 RepID=UPI0035B4B177